MPKFLNLIQYVDDGTQWTDNPNNNESGLRTIKLSQHKDPGTTIMRDSSGRAEISDPVGDYDIANKGYVNSFAVSYSTTQSLPNDSKQKARENIGAAKAADSGEYVTTGKSTDAATTVDQTIYTGKIFKGNNTFSGDVKYTGLVTADDNIVNKKYVDDNIATGQSNLNLGNGSGQGSLLQKNVKSSSDTPYNNIASGPACVAFGKNTQALGNTDFVIGQNNTADTSGSFVGGNNCSNTLNSNYSFVFGDNVINKYAPKSIIAGSDIENSAGGISVVLGRDIVNPLRNSFLIGRGLRSQNYLPFESEDGITILGKYNKRATTGEDADGTSFIIGNGTSEEDRSNAIKLSTKNGLECFIEPKTDNGVVRKLELNSKIDKPINPIQTSVVTLTSTGTVGTKKVSDFIEGSDFNVGNGTGQGSLIQTNVKSSDNTPYTNVANGPASIALGKKTKALGNTDFVIGQNNEANASGSFVGGINCSNTDNSNYSFVFGDSVNNQVATKSVVMGSDIQNSAGNSIILGSDITNPLKNSFLIGRGLRSQDYISPYNDNAEYGITILGRYNKRATQGEDSDGTSFIIGDGTSDANRHNAIKLSDVNGLECFIEPKTDYGVVRKTDLDSETMDLRLVSNSIRRAVVFSAVIGASPMSRLAASETTKKITTKQAIVFHSFPTNGGGSITITVPSGYERSDASSLENIIVTSDLFIMSKIGKSRLETRYEYLVCTESDVVSLFGTTDETLSIQIINPTEWLSETIDLKKTL